MALLSCPDCRREVSDLAPACPGCGRPINPSTRLNEPPRLAPVQVSHFSHQETGTFTKSFGNTSGKLLGCLSVFVLVGLVMAALAAIGKG